MGFQSIKSYAKINLSLGVVGKLKSGFHKIETIVSFLNLHDEIKIKKIISKIRFAINRYCKLFSLRSIKLLPINVKNVRKANKIVKIKITIMNKFLFNKANIN